MVNTTVPVTIGGEKYPDFANRKAYENSHKSAYHLGAQNGSHVIGFRNRLHTGNIGKADAHNDRKPGT